VLIHLLTYAPKHADVAGPRLLGNVGIAAAIRVGMDKLLEVVSLKAEDIVAKLELIATADPSKLTGHHIGACRYCYGVDHHYQWRTPREFSEAVELHMLKGEAYAANHPPTSDHHQLSGITHC
jgi:phage terminase small subunit